MSENPSVDEWNSHNIFVDIVMDLFEYIRDTSSECNFKSFVVTRILIAKDPELALKQVESLGVPIINYMELFFRANKDFCLKLSKHPKILESTFLEGINEWLEISEAGTDSLEDWRLELIKNMGYDNEQS